MPLMNSDLRIPEKLLDPQDQSNWEWQAGKLKLADLIHVFAKAVDHYHAQIDFIRNRGNQMDAPQKNSLLSAWNAAGILAVHVVNRFSSDDQAESNGCGDVISEGLHCVGDFMEDIGNPHSESWKNRKLYYDGIDGLIIQGVQDDFFGRHSPP